MQLLYDIIAVLEFAWSSHTGKTPNKGDIRGDDAESIIS